MTSVLIVDDDDAFRTTVGRDIAEHGYRVSLARDADAATAALGSTPFDILLTDLRMPGADGIDLLDRVRTLAPRTRTILMSGFASARDYERAIEFGAVRVLCKPFTSSELLQAIRQAVDCETGFRGNIHGLSLVDLLQMFHYARRSLAIVVDSWEPGHVYLKDGRVIHAAFRELVGEPAVRAILAMPTGSLRTMVLPEGTPHTVNRDLEGLLLDALRELDESRQHASAAADAAPPWDFDALDELGAAPRPRVQIFFERLRRIDGYRTACLVDSESGVILGTDGDFDGLDLPTAVAGYSELYRIKRGALAAFAPDDRLCDIVMTFGRQYHVLHTILAQPTFFLYVVLERRGNLGLVTLALEAAEAALDG